MKRKPLAPGQLWSCHGRPARLVDAKGRDLYEHLSSRPAVKKARPVSGARLESIEVGAPSVEALRVAKFAHDLGVKLLRIRHDVALRWFRPSDSEARRGVQGKAAPDRSAVYVRQADHALDFLTEIVLHELKHIELDSPFNNPTRERICLEFGAKWSGAVHAAGRATEFDAKRVTQIDERNPSHAYPSLRPRRGDVVLSKANARAWEWRGDWRELLT